jgi:hypothetical protein
MPEFTENEKLAQPDGAISMPIQAGVRQNFRRRRNPIVSNSHPASTKKMGSVIGPCEPKVEKSFPVKRGDGFGEKSASTQECEWENKHYSTAVEGDEGSNWREKKSPRPRNEFVKKSTMENRRNGRQFIRREAQNCELEAKPCGLLGKFLRIVWPFGRKKQVEHRNFHTDPHRFPSRHRHHGGRS